MPSKQRHGRRVQVIRPIPAPAHEVWSTIWTPGNLELVHPFCEHNPVTTWPGDNAHDEVHYRSGWVYDRHFTDRLDGVGYDLDIGAAGEPTSHVRWRIEPRGGMTCSPSISVRPRRLTGIPVLESVIDLLAVRPLLRRYPSSVVRGVEWFVLHGEPVAANHFGAHPFEAKLVDMVGLYLNPPEAAAVFAFDEKPQVQALDRTQPSLPMIPGRAGTMTHDYRRNGTVDLFAAMNVATGEVLHDTRRRHAGTDVLAFFKRIDVRVPAGQELHVVLDNLSAHKSQPVRDWLDHPKRRRWHLHFTPTSSSWLNLVETWFSVLTRKALADASFTSVAELSDRATLDRITKSATHH